MGVLFKIEVVSERLDRKSTSFIFHYPDGTAEGVYSPDLREITTYQENMEALHTMMKRYEQVKTEKEFGPIKWVKLYQEE